MFKSRRSSQPTVSPLAPPPASTYNPNRPPSQHPQGQQYPHQAQFQPQPHPGQPRMNSVGRGDGQRFSPGSVNPNDELHRIGTNGTMGTMDGSVSSNSEKRRSGFFGFGKKDKHKDKDQHKEEIQPRPSSFSIDRPATHLHPPVRPEDQRSPEPGFIPPPSMSDRYPRPQPNQGDFGGSPPPGHRNQNGSPLGQGHFQGQAAVPNQRAVSSPQSPPPNGDFGTGTPQAFPKSQSMGFAPRPGHQNASVPETHPYRGFLNAQEEKAALSNDSAQRNVSRSNSMPLDQINGGLNDQPKGTPPPIEKETMRGSPSFDRIKSAESGGPPPSWLKQFDTIVELIGLQPQKTYVASPPELEMILARTSAGGQPKQGQPGSASNDWDSVWLQLSGISLSMWSMKETRAAAAKAEKVPPTYFNITDSSLETLAPLPPPPHRPKSHPHHFVFGLNTAGSNRLLFSCPTERDLAKWSTGLRLAAWERARLEEIYTGHLIKAGGREPKIELVRGRMEGWVRVRVMGGTDWKRLWLVISTPNAPEDKEEEKKNRRRSIFGFGDKEKEVVQEPNTGISMASFYLEPRTSKNKTSIAVLTVTDITQAYAVFPERLEVIAQSNLMKVVGRVGGDLVTIEGRVRESGWALIMPETPEAGAGTPPPQAPLANMMKWVTGFHDVFGLCGRPDRYNWDTQDPRSLFFAYPRGPDRSRLFLDLDDALQSDFRISSLPVFRRQYAEITQRKLAGPIEQYGEDKKNPTPRTEGSYRLPPLQFGEPSPAVSHESGLPRSLTPITERTDIASRTNSTRTAGSNFYMNERKVSDGPPTKQSSGASSKHMAGASGEERLAPISDSTENFGQYTEEPVAGQTLPDTTPTTVESSTAHTSWSQSTGQTPGVNETSPLNFPVPAQPSRSGSTITPLAVPPKVDDRDLPDLPVASANTPSAAATAAPVALAAPVQSPSHSAPMSNTTPRSISSADNVVVSPQPRKGSVAGATPSSATALRDEPAAMYLMNMVEQSPVATKNPSLSSNVPTAKNEPAQLVPITSSPRKSPSPERPRIITQFDSQRSSNEPLGRKPSGARAPPPKKGSTHNSRNLEVISDSSPKSGQSPELPSEGKAQKARMPSTDLGEDAAHFMAYADQPSPAKQTVPIPPAAPAPKPEEELRSSFAPSRAAAERRAKAEQAVQEQQSARNVPGGGKRTAGSASKDAWSDSEDEEEVEEEQSPQVECRGIQHGQEPSATSSSSQQNVHRVVSQTRALPPVPRVNGEEIANRDSQYSQRDFDRPQQAREYSSFSAGPDRPRSRSPAAPHRQMPQQPVSAPIQPPAQRQTLWNANFSAEHGMDQPKSGKFVDLEEPNAQLTKAFAPHGLLQAGMQDKEDRSAKRQEELAKETGSSLINVPSKPPPPQTGLLGAVAAHERDRKNAGGIGATLTDREREKRLAEERSREIEKLQRQQMEHMSKYGGDTNMGPQSMYGQYGYGMPNVNMMGMPPMGFNPYQQNFNQGGYNPYAQQQAMMAAQMAYQQAMMSMSHAGSQAGAQSPDRPASPVSGHGGLPPNAGGGPGGMSPSPSMGPYGNYFGQPQGFMPPWGNMGNMGNMGMPWSPSPPPQMGGSWLQPPGMMGGHGQMQGPGMNGSEDGRDSRSRVHSMVSDSGQVQNGPVN